MASALSHARARFDVYLDHQFSVYCVARSPHILSELQPSKKTLEIGCGSALNWTPALARVSDAVYALELVEPRIQHAKKRLKMAYDDINNITYISASGEELPFEDNAFDLIVSIDVIEHVPDDAKMLREIARVLRPGGKVIMTTMLEDRPSYIRKFTFDDHLREYEVQTFNDLFTQANLTRIEPFTFYRFFSTLMRELDGIVSPVSSKIPIVGILVKMGFALIARLERIFPLGRPSGVGIVAYKPDSP